MTTPISPLPTPPTPADSPADFNTKAFALLGALPAFVTEANAQAAGLDTAVADATTQAGAADTKAGEALTSANAAALSKTNADEARDAAVIAKNAAEAALDSLDDRYLGAKAVAPTVDNDGNALLTGALYWDTALPGMRSWNGTEWVTLPAATKASVGLANVDNTSDANKSVLSAATLTTARTINGFSFDGSADISINATAVPNTPAGSIAATTVQAAINELDSEKLAKAGGVMTGDLSIPSLNGGPLAGTRNFLINGCMRVAQRGNVEFTGTNNLYGGADRWLTSISGTTVSAVALQAEYAGSRSGYAHQIGNLTTTGATTAAISQRIEALNSRALNGKTVTFSGKVLQQTGAARTLTRSTTKANAKDNFEGGQTTLSSNTVDVPNNVVTPFIFTFSLGAADGNNGISMLVGFNALPAMSSAQLYFFDMQLEVGETATPLEYRSIGMEEALCRRYYCRQAFYIGAIYNTVANTEWGASVQWPVPMRATPTVYVIGGAAGAGSSNPTIDTPSSTNARVTFVAGPAGAVAQASGNAVASSEI